MFRSLADQLKPWALDLHTVEFVSSLRGNLMQRHTATKWYKDWLGGVVETLSGMKVLSTSSWQATTSSDRMYADRYQRVQPAIRNDYQFHKYTVPQNFPGWFYARRHACHAVINEVFSISMTAPHDSINCFLHISVADLSTKDKLTRLLWQGISKHQASIQDQFRTGHRNLPVKSISRNN